MDTKVLVIDDDAPFCQMIGLVLSKKGFQVALAHAGPLGLQMAYACHPDVILLDAVMPGLDGFETCRRIRRMCDAPIIMLTSLGLQEDRLRGLEAGADDYVVKPVTIGELEARIKAVLRRDSRTGFDGKDATSVVTFDGLMIDFERHQVTVDSKPVNLTPREFSLLAVLARNQGKVVSHEHLLREVWGPQYISERNYVRLYISCLRRKLERDPSKPCLIHCQWGVGYRLG